MFELQLYFVTVNESTYYGKYSFLGNCLELAGTGILNHVSCKNTFSSGCPDSFYFGNEIYKCE